MSITEESKQNLFYLLSFEFNNNDVYKSLDALSSKLACLLHAEYVSIFRLDDNNAYSKVRPADKQETDMDKMLSSHINGALDDFDRDINVDQVKRILGLKLDNYFLVAINGYKLEEHKESLNIVKDVVGVILNNASPAIDMTGLKNRSSYDNTRLSFLSKKEKPITLVSIDLFNLKAVNDDPVKGDHLKGDAYIKGVASILAKTFNGFADMYRIGGDEFVLLIDKSYDEIKDELIDKIGQACVMTSELDVGVDGAPLRINYGIASGSSHDIENVRGEADKLLKENKTNMYLALGIDRRGSKPHNPNVAYVTRAHL